MMEGILSCLAHWPATCCPVLNENQAGTMFMFTAGPQLRADERAVLHTPGSGTEHSMSRSDFLQQAHLLKDHLVAKLPLLGPETSLSRMLQAPEVVAALDQMSLSDVLSAGRRCGEEASSEHLSWTIMDHVLAFPYFHPDGFVHGTQEYHDWRVSIQKQYAMLLCDKSILEGKRISASKRAGNLPSNLPSGTDCLSGWVLLDVYGGTDSVASHDLGNELLKISAEERKLSCRINAFRAEQRVLQKAYLRTITAALGSMENKRTSSLLNETSAMSKPSKAIRGSLNPSHKRSACESAARSSAGRSQAGHKFSRAQKKQRKVEHVTESSARTSNQEQRLEVEGTREDNVAPSFEEDETLVDSEVDEAELAVDDDVQIDREGSEQIVRDIDAAIALVEEMQLTNREVRDIGETLNQQYAQSSRLDELEEAESMIFELELELSEVKAMSQDIERALSEKDEHDLTVGEVAVSISDDRRNCINCSGHHEIARGDP